MSLENKIEEALSLAKRTGWYKWSSIPMRYEFLTETVMSVIRQHNGWRPQ